MGGHKAGEVASRLVVEGVVEGVRRGCRTMSPEPGVSIPGQLLWASVHAANTRILEHAAANPDLSGMGTTVVAATLRHGLLTVAHAGDSRAYLFDGNYLTLLTQDDSWLAALLAANPNPHPAEFERHPMRNVLTNVVGLRPDMDVHLREVPLSGGELVVLTTDGVHGVLEPERLAQVVADHPPADVPARLIQAAMARGSRDNCTAVLAQYLEG
jgi:protein phosphatase